MKTKLIVIWVGVILLVGMCLYPPWISKRHHKLASHHLSLGVPFLDKLARKAQAQELSRRPAEIRQYSFLFSPPKHARLDRIQVITIYYNTELDLTRLGLQLIMGIVLIGGILFTLSVLGKKKESNKE